MVDNSEKIWDRIEPKRRKRLIWGLWFITWALLLAGLADRRFYEVVVVFTALHTILFLFLLRFDLKAFPVQVRLAYLVWATAGTYVPALVVLMYIATVGLASNLFIGYCPLARMLYLLPWNRRQPFTLTLLKKVFLSPPVEGAFHLDSN